jgi:hypothetical protein
MSALTTKLQLYKAGGGLSGLITPDEIADIDRINSNFDLIDANTGFRVVTSGTRPISPYDGLPILETDTKKIAIWNNGAGVWQNPGSERGSGTDYVIADLNSLAGITDQQAGDVVQILAAAGWMMVRNSANTAWVHGSAGYFSGTAARDTEYAKAGGIYLNTGGIAAKCFLSAFSAAPMTYRGAAGSGSWCYDQPLVPLKATTVTATGGAVTATGTPLVVVTGTCTELALDGCFQPDFEDYEIHIKATGSVASNLLLKLRAAGVDISAGYQWGNVDASFAGTSTAAGSVADTSMLLGRINAAAPSPSWTKLFVTKPFQTQQKVFNWLGTYGDRARTGGGLYATATSCSGFSITPSTGNMQILGLQVFGVSNNN